MRALDIFSGTQYSLPHFSPWPRSNVGERIRAARLRRRLTLRELAARELGCIWAIVPPTF
jgi:hypothetical protein